MSGDEVPRAHPTQLLAQQRGVEQLRGLAKPYRFRVEADAGDSPSNPRPRALAGLGEDGQGIFRSGSRTGDHSAALGREFRGDGRVSALALAQTRKRGQEVNTGARSRPAMRGGEA